MKLARKNGLISHWTTFFFEFVPKTGTIIVPRSFFCSFCFSSDTDLDAIVFVRFQVPDAVEVVGVAVGEARTGHRGGVALCQLEAATASGWNKARANVPVHSFQTVSLMEHGNDFRIGFAVHNSLLFGTKVCTLLSRPRSGHKVPADRVPGKSEPARK